VKIQRQKQKELVNYFNLISKKKCNSAATHRSSGNSFLKNPLQKNYANDVGSN
jgi:hypothetical protein